MRLQTVLLCFLVAELALWADAGSQRVVCYYTNWSVYRPGTAKFSPQNINPYLCTHLIYAFGGLTRENGLRPYDKYQDIEQGGYAKFTGLKTYNKNLKTMLAIGGWNEGSTRFSPLVADAERRREFVRNALRFLRQNHFDGLDLDWEYPAFRDGGKARDRANYAQLVKELRDEFDREADKTGRPRLLLTMAVPAGIEYIDKGFDVPTLNRYLDFMNILTYDYHSAFEPAVNHHSPLYSLEEDDEYNFDAQLNIDHTVSHYLELGADRDKLVLGIPTYGRSYTLFNPLATELGAPADGPGEQGDSTREKGYLAYYEICDNLESSDWKVVQPNPKAMGPYAFKGNQWVGYDDLDIVKHKAQYVGEKGLGGIMFWAIDNDDFRGKCHGRAYPLIEAGKEALIASASRSSNDIVPSGKRPSKTRPSSRQRSEDSESPSPTPGSSRKNNRRPSSKGRSRHRGRSSTTTSTTTTTPPTTITTPAYNTPEPPTTPDPGSDFKCKDDGFFPHPRDCKKYFWCLDSGPSNLGIVAHQFTCPSGLFFNKAADSCDYKRNVVCKEKVIGGTATDSTTRAPITAATSKTTRFSSPTLPSTTTTTTTQAPELDEDEEEYEFEDEDEDEDVDAPGAEEDPQAIKELINLIKKLGGLEQLEKQLHLQDGESDKNKPSTTSTLSRSLYDRVLSRNNNRGNNGILSTTTPITDTTKYTSQFRNRPIQPQNEGLEHIDDDTVSRRERPTYVELRRPSTKVARHEENDEEDDEDDDVEEDDAYKPKQNSKSHSPEYVTIQRARPTSPLANKDDDEDEDIDEVEENEEDEYRRKNPTSKLPGPEYITLQRNQPANPTPSEASPRYVTINRPRPKIEANTVIAEDSTVLDGIAITEKPILNANQNTFRPEEEELSVTKKPRRIAYRTTARSLTSEIESTVRTQHVTGKETTILESTTEPGETSVVTKPRPGNTRLAFRPKQKSTTTPEVEETTIRAKGRRTFRPTSSTGVTETENNSETRNTQESTRSTFKPKSTASEDGSTTPITKTRRLFRPSTSPAPKTLNTELDERPTEAKFTRTTLSPRQRTTSAGTDGTDLLKEQRGTFRPTTLESITVSGGTDYVFDESTTIQGTTYPPVTSRSKITNPEIQVSNAATKEQHQTIRPSTNFEPTPVFSEVDVTTKIKTFPGSSRTSPRPRPETTTPTTKEQSTLHSSSTLHIDSEDEAIATKVLVATARPAFRSNSKAELSSTGPEVLRSSTAAATELTFTSDQVPSLATESLLEGVIVGPNTEEEIIRVLTDESEDEEPDISSEKHDLKGATSLPAGTLLTSKNFLPTPTSKPSTTLAAAPATSSEAPRRRPGTRIVRRRKYGPGSATNRTSTTEAPTSEAEAGKPRKYNFPRRRVTPLISSTISVGISTALPPTTVDRKSVIRDDMDLLESMEYPTTGLDNEPIVFDSSSSADQNSATLAPTSPLRARLRGRDESSLLSTRRPTISTTSAPVAPRRGLFSRQHTKSTLPVIISTTVGPPAPVRLHPRPFSKLPVSAAIPQRSHPVAPIVDYEYYDDEDSAVLDVAPLSKKVKIHADGYIQCLDQGNFPHPFSCKKFISCAKMENGDLLGWEYTCPRQLSFDPIGGICNWSAGLGCKE